MTGASAIPVDFVAWLSYHHAESIRHAGSFTRADKKYSSGMERRQPQPLGEAGLHDDAAGNGSLSPQLGHDADPVARFGGAPPHARGNALRSRAAPGNLSAERHQPREWHGAQGLGEKNAFHRRRTREAALPDRARQTSHRGGRRSHGAHRAAHGSAAQRRGAGNTEATASHNGGGDAQVPLNRTRWPIRPQRETLFQSLQCAPTFS